MTAEGFLAEKPSADEFLAAPIQLPPPKGMVEQTIVEPGAAVPLVPGAPNGRSAMVEGPPTFRKVLTYDPRIPPGTRMGPMGPEDDELTRVLGGDLLKAQQYVGDVARGAVADVAAAEDRVLGSTPGKGGPDYLGNTWAALRGKPLPIDEAIKLAAQSEAEDGKFPAAATVAKVGQGLAASAPMIAGFAGLPGLAQRGVAAGFALKMLLEAPGQFGALEEELSKPESERDPDKVAQLVSDAAQTMVFTPLAAVGAMRETPLKPVETKTDLPNTEQPSTEPAAASAESPAMADQRPVATDSVQTSEPVAVEGVTNEPLEVAKPAEATPDSPSVAASGGEGAAKPGESTGSEAGPAADSGAPGSEGEPVATAAVAGEPKVFAMAAGGAPVPAAAPLPPPPLPPRAVPSVPGVPPVKPGVVAAIGQHFQSARRFVQNFVAPQNIDPEAKLFSLVLRENDGRRAAEMVRSEEAMSEFRGQFDRTPVDLKSYVYDPAQPLPHNFQVMDAFERNRAALPPDLQGLAKTFDDEFATRIAEIQKFKPELLKNLIADYFPHVWQNPDGLPVREFMAEVASRAPLEGNKAFLKQRSLPFFVDGLARGLKPVHDNPVDLLMAKMHQLDKFAMALRTIDEAKQRGWMRWLPIGQRLPEGFKIVDDPAFTVHAPPYLEVKEAFDAGIRKGLLDFIAKMGFTHDRVAMVKVKGLMNAFGVYRSGGDIESRFGGPDGVIMHEIGHGLDERYGLFNVLAANKQMAAELKGLADLRAEPGKKVSAKFQQYLHMPEEQVANAVHAYIYAPELMEAKAPTVKRAMEAFIGAHPELEDLNTIKPSLAIATSKTRLPVAGPILAGHWTLPEGPAQVLTNHLSPGLAQWWPYRSLRAGSNILNAAQLGLSGFHLGFTSLDAAFSTLGTAITEAARGNLGRGAVMALQSAVAPVRNYRLGKVIQNEIIKPGSSGMPKAQMIAELAVRAGLRATVDPFWKTQFSRNLVRAWNRGTAGGYAESMYHLPFAAIEQSMRPIAEYVVPRQKLGVFATIAESEARKLGPGATTDQIRMAMAKAADMTENRMGQMTYSNLHYNRMIKDAALVAFRAYGWQLGKYRELAGVLGDSARFVKDIAQVRKPEFTNRMGYAAALVAGSAIVGGTLHYLMTGRPPQSAMDYFHPSLGKTDDNGHEMRLSLPTYLKDLESDAKYMSRGWDEGGALGLTKGLWNSSYHRLNPAAGFAVDMMNNRDFFGTQIWNPNDPWTAKALDQAKFVAKQFTPFSIIGAMKVKGDAGGPLEWALPFVGVVPAKKALTMTPAEAKAAEIMQASMPAAARTKDQALHSQLVKDLVRDYRNGKLNDQGELVARVRGTGIAVPTKTPADKTKLTQLEQRMLWTPLQYQVNKMPLKNAMEVFDLASDEEKVTLAPFVFRKTTNAMKNLDTETASRYAKIIVPWYQKALAARQGK